MQFLPESCSLSSHLPPKHPSLKLLLRVNACTNAWVRCLAIEHNVFLRHYASSFHWTNLSLCHAEIFGLLGRHQNTKNTNQSPYSLSEFQDPGCQSEPVQVSGAFMELLLAMDKQSLRRKRLPGNRSRRESVVAGFGKFAPVAVAERAVPMMLRLKWTLRPRMKKNSHHHAPSLLNLTQETASWRVRLQDLFLY